VINNRRSINVSIQYIHKVVTISKQFYHYSVDYLKLRPRTGSFDSVYTLLEEKYKNLIPEYGGWHKH
jgi:hypothetical protein